MKIIVHQLLLMLLFSAASAHTLQSGNLGGNIGLSIAAGNRFDRVGFFVQPFYTGDFFQVNPSLHAWYHFKNLGPQEKYFEWTASMGLVIAYGETNTSENHFFSVISNQTLRRNSIGYAYNFYWNKIGTTQSTGTVSLQFNAIQIIVENDFFAFTTNDQFRTGAFLLQYRYQKFQFGINSTLWTGAKGSSVNDASFPSRMGYIDMSNSLYGNISHGLLSLQVQYAAPYGQLVQASAGIDAEQVRNVLQNKIMHDLVFTPEKWQLSDNPHIPMIDSTGIMYLYKEGQQIKPIQFYYNLFLNPDLFY